MGGGCDQGVEARARDARTVARHAIAAPLSGPSKSLGAASGIILLAAQHRCRMTGMKQT